MTSVLTQEEFTELDTWMQSHKGDIPPSIRSLIERLMALYFALAKTQRKSKEVLLQLRTAMGFIPKSERGSQISEKHVREVRS